MRQAVFPSECNLVWSCIHDNYSFTLIKGSEPLNVSVQDAWFWFTHRIYHWSRTIFVMNTTSRVMRDQLRIQDFTEENGESQPIIWPNFAKNCIERNNSYYFCRANQQKADTKIYSLTQCSLTVNEYEWHILAVNDERINSHCLTRKMKKIEPREEWVSKMLLCRSATGDHDIWKTIDFSQCPGFLHEMKWNGLYQCISCGEWGETVVLIEVTRTLDSSFS